MNKPKCRLRDQKTGKIIVPELEVAGSLWAQSIGLMGRRALASNMGLYIPHCNAIHTAFVRFPIDVIFLDSDLNAVRLISALEPWRLIGFVRGAKSVVELPAGTIQRQRIVVGQRFIVDRSAT